MIHSRNKMRRGPGPNCVPVLAAVLTLLLGCAGAWAQGQSEDGARKTPGSPPATAKPVAPSPEPDAPAPGTPGGEGAAPRVRARDSRVDPAIAEKDRVGALFPIPMGSAKDRARTRNLYEKALRPAGRRYQRAVQVRDPLERFHQTNNPKHAPDPRRGGRGNNDSDRITNLLLGWLLYGDERARETAIKLAFWLAEFPDRQDHGHVQRHPAIGLAALATRDGASRARLLNAFLVAFHRHQNSRFFVDDPEDDSWMFGMAGVRPFLRSVGAAYRFAHVYEALRREGHLTDEMAKSVPMKFESPRLLLERVEDRLTQFYSWKKLAGDEAKRGWQLPPAEWIKARNLAIWPYLPSRDPRGEHVTWFHYGCIWPYEMLVVQTHGGNLSALASERTKEIATFALEVGYDGGHDRMTGLNMKSSKGTFHPKNKQLLTAFRNRPREERLQGEAAYSIAPALYYAKAMVVARQKQLRRHLRVTKAVAYPGEVSWATLMVLYAWSKGE